MHYAICYLIAFKTLFVCVGGGVLGNLCSRNSFLGILGKRLAALILPRESGGEYSEGHVEKIRWPRKEGPSQGEDGWWGAETTCTSIVGQLPTCRKAGRFYKEWGRSICAEAVRFSPGTLLVINSSFKAVWIYVKHKREAENTDKSPICPIWVRIYECKCPEKDRKENTWKYGQWSPLGRRFTGGRWRLKWLFSWTVWFLYRHQQVPTPHLSWRAFLMLQRGEQRL